MGQIISPRISKKYQIFYIFIFLLTFISFISGCATPGKRTAIGAGAGAGGGAIIGGIAGGGKGALIGAGLGAMIGGAIGNRLDKQAQELQQVAQTKRTQEGILVNLKSDLLFDTGSSMVKPEAENDIRQLAQIIVKYPKDVITIQGYTDNVGSESLNQKLSMRRALAVKNIMTSQGVPETQMSAQGMGKNSPVASNQTKVGRSKNRRVELHIQDAEQIQAQRNNQNQNQQLPGNQQNQQTQEEPSTTG